MTHQKKTTDVDMIKKTDKKINKNAENKNAEKIILVGLDKNGIRTDHKVNINALKTVGDIFQALNINEETALLFYKNKPIPTDYPIQEIIENIQDHDFQILKVIFDE